MKSSNETYPMLKSITIMLSLCAVLLISATQQAAAQVGWAVGNKATILYTPNGTDKNGWTIQAAPADTENLNGVSAFDANNAWIVGNRNLPKRPNGTILYFDGTLNNDGKQVWKLQDSKVQVNLNGVTFVSAKKGWAVGDAGTILYTKDGGTTWTTQNKGGPNLYGISVWASGNKYAGRAVGDVKNGKPTVLYTQDADAGQWTAFQNPPNTNNVARSVSIDWVVGDATFGVWRYVGNGQWNPQDLGVYKRTADLRAVQRLRQAGYTWVAGKVQRLNDGRDVNVLRYNGVVWSSESTLIKAFDVYGLAFINKDQGWVVGQGGYIFHASDGSAIGIDAVDWEPQRNPYAKSNRQQLNAIAMLKKAGQDVKLGESTSPASGVAGASYLSLSASDFPEGNINPANVAIQLAVDCRGPELANVPAASVVSGSRDGKLVSFLLPDGLSPGNYFVSISDSTEGDANFESSNCSEVNVSQ